MNAGSIRRQGVRVYCSPVETQADTGWIFFREENHHVEINARRSRRDVTSQPSPTTVPELSQTRERVRRRHDCKPPTFAETLSSLAGLTRRTTVCRVAGCDYQVLYLCRGRQVEADQHLVPRTVSSLVFSLCLQSRLVRATHRLVHRRTPALHS
jgi:hypothetical protein